MKGIHRDFKNGFVNNRLVLDHEAKSMNLVLQISVLLRSVNSGTKESFVMATIKLPFLTFRLSTIFLIYFPEEVGQTSRAYWDYLKLYITINNLPCSIIIFLPVINIPCQNLASPFKEIILADPSGRFNFPLVLVGNCGISRLLTFFSHEFPSRSRFAHFILLT